MVNKMSLRKGDKVIVIAGRDKGVRGEVIKVIPRENRVIVQGAALTKRHRRASADSQGGIETKEGTIHRSNVALIDPKTDKATRVAFRFNQEGQKLRYSKASQEIID
ncbi:MAG: 50S ribosomal protein L24 [Alphaproteobacteria bacterium GM7ARS4]|nr:50S ribosomal protein L24 [Alphaproteobacteria bacterium GM7ARS4]